MRKKLLVELLNEYVRKLPPNETEDTRITLLRDYLENVSENDITYDDFDYYLHREYQISLDDFDDELTEFFFDKFRDLSSHIR